MGKGRFALQFSLAKGLNIAEYTEHENTLNLEKNRKSFKLQINLDRWAKNLNNELKIFIFYKKKQHKISGRSYGLLDQRLIFIIPFFISNLFRLAFVSTTQQSLNTITGKARQRKENFRIPSALNKSLMHSTTKRIVTMATVMTILTQRTTMGMMQGRLKMTEKMLMMKI